MLQECSLVLLVCYHHVPGLLSPGAALTLALQLSCKLGSQFHHLLIMMNIQREIHIFKDSFHSSNNIITISLLFLVPSLERHSSGEREYNQICSPRKSNEAF